MLIQPEKKAEFAALCVLVFLIAVGVIWVRTATVKHTYEYVRQEKELQRLQQDMQAARVEWVRMTSPKRLDRVAEKLGLAPPRIHQVVKYASDLSTTENTKRALR